MSGYTSTSSDKKELKSDIFINSIIVIIIPLLLLLILNPLQKTMALSPSFELQEMINENHHWVQTYGNSDTHLKSSYTDMRAVDYISDGKTLNATFWLASGFENSSTAIYNQPFRKISYGMLIDANSNPKTGYNGADYDFYVESVAGKLSEYLYQLSSTGEYRLVGSRINYTQPFFDSNLNLGSVNLQLPLGSINYPTKYVVMFYSAESFKSNEVRQFTSWVDIPPPSLQITTSPSTIMIREGEEQLIPARIESTSGFSNDIINMTVSSDIGSGFNSSELHVAIPRIQPPLFKIAVPQQTPLGIYTIPLIVTIREPSAATLAKSISINARGGMVNPEFALSKTYPTVGYLTRPLNLTITVIAPSSISDQFRYFWDVYGGFIGIIGIVAGGFVAAYATLMFERKKKAEK